MSRLWLLRHGPTHAKCMVGWTDLPADLSDHAAISRLCAHLPDVPVVSSDLARAVATADTLAPRRRLPHDPELREIHFGQWEMKTFAEAEASDPALIRAFWESPGSVTAPGGESWDGLVARVTAALLRLCAQEEELIVVCHFGAIIAAIQAAGGLTATEAMAHHIDNLSVTRLDFGADARIHRINHLP